MSTVSQVDLRGGSGPRESDPDPIRGPEARRLNARAERRIEEWEPPDHEVRNLPKQGDDIRSIR